MSDRPLQPRLGEIVRDLASAPTPTGSPHAEVTPRELSAMLAIAIERLDRVVADQQAIADRLERIEAALASRHLGAAAAHASSGT
jgi:hypothetical protein